MKSSKLKYSEHLETLTALVTHLAMSKKILRTPRHLARSLSIDESEVTLVLEGFKSLFRKSPNPSKQSQSPMYALQLRYARKWLEENSANDDADSNGEQDATENASNNNNDRDESAPLESQYLIALLNLVADRANEETRHASSIKVAWIPSVAAIVAAIITVASTVYIAYHLTPPPH